MTREQLIEQIQSDIAINGSFKTKKKLCMFCLYHETVNGHMSLLSCGYHSLTGKHRGDVVGICDKFEVMDEKLLEHLKKTRYLEGDEENELCGIYQEEAEINEYDTDTDGRLLWD